MLLLQAHALCWGSKQVGQGKNHVKSVLPSAHTSCKPALGTPFDYIPSTHNDFESSLYPAADLTTMKDNGARG
jgi:hypothetical protein